MARWRPEVLALPPAVTAGRGTIARSLRQGDSHAGKQPAIDSNVLAGHEAGSAARQEGDDFGHLAWPGDTPQRMHSTPPIDELFRPFWASVAESLCRCAEHRRIHRSGTD